ncbi:hypothetical protein GQ53DRAFT_401572 [Thozetella sp. PMI_491]|nr:hypothetical protein GQ53DRAFT_401572 [Thozetella sp. PMI_491]
MRPPRVAILVLFFSASLFLFCRSISALRRSPTTASQDTTQKASFRPFFSFAAPFTLFPPNADISLTDDNSTSFPARPAAFGPPLPAKGLSGQLWIGSGFAEDNLQDGESEGELGCSDVSGWGDGQHMVMKAVEKALASDRSASGKSATPKRADDLSKGPAADRKVPIATKPVGPAPVVDDGTDDYLHEALSKHKKTQESSTASGASHADIQSIQETAEITGKIVLLSRGGCGFLEKVKWAQRRGATALIVGDNQKGAPLIQMFARGDVSNVTIPSIFTSRTTAHLLSSLMHPGSFIEDILDENGNPLLKVQQSEKLRKNKKGKQTATAAAAMPKATSDPKSIKAASDRKDPAKMGESDKSSQGGWLWRLFHWGGGDASVSAHSRPPSSGRLDWVLVDDWSDEKDKDIKSSLDKASKGKDHQSEGSQALSGDDFQIGVQDWRDPDLVNPSGQSTKESGQKSAGTGGQSYAAKPAASKQTEKQSSDSSKDANGPKGGSITPSSGEYVPEYVTKERDASSGKRKSSGSPSSQGGIMSKIFGEDDGTYSAGSDGSASPISPAPEVPEPPRSSPGGRPEHEGLWVTITPTGSASPFFDTLLVLVISPLITLTLVYALLILRAKIRRRRWRAPKSVVEQLPVRTYHTVATTPAHSPRLPSPTSSSPTTPLLQGSSRSRPRSRTTTGVPDATDLLRVDAALQNPHPPSRPEPEKGPGSGNMSSEWKKYMGRQVECVVCLEEYVDGVSRVMSLPCGHEFHVECITPWLTTRRRTCPICKGDVVRSLARGSPSSPRYEPYRDDSDDDFDISGPGRRSPSPVREDLEQGVTIMPAPRPGRRRRNESSENWFTMLSNSLGAGSSRPRGYDSESDEDRNR